MNITSLRCDTRPIDGYLVDAKGKTFPAETEPEQLEAFGQPQDQIAFYVNGINSDIPRQLGDMERIHHPGHRLLGIHNATAGVIRDLAQCVADKVNCGHNGAVNTVKSLLMSAIESQRHLVLYGHSQGALICSRALEEVSSQMIAGGWSETDVQDKLANVEVFTAGGASYTYPSGPKYHHKVNLYDPVAVFAGLASHLPGTDPGNEAELETIKKFVKPSEAAPNPPGTACKISPLDKCVHGTSVYYDAK